MIDRMKFFQEDAQNLKSTLNASGRFSFQRNAMKYVFSDVATKLAIQPTDDLLDIGCNCGDISIPLSFLCSNVTCIDGEGAINRLNKRIADLDNIDTIVGNFFDVDIEQQYDCILAYSVLMYVDGYEKKRDFIKKACELLKPGGRMLVGDIANPSVKKRFEDSSIGKSVDSEYKKLIQNMTDEDRIKSRGDKQNCQLLDDQSLFKLMYEIRTWNKYESFLLPQNNNLPFGYTRQDILVIRWG